VLVEDLEIYVARPGRSHPLDRYARAAGLAPGSDRAIVHEAMRHARFSLWRVERHHKTEGLILRDVETGWSTKPWQRERDRGWRWPCAC
jgi:hypothetical protein